MKKRLVIGETAKGAFPVIKGKMDLSNRKILALIGARSGSKGVPHKNIRPLLGKPLVGWVIDAAKRSKYVNRVIVCTDSEEYAKIAKSLGAEVPYLQPVEVSQQMSTDYEYVSYALNWFEKNEGYMPDVVVRLMPTVPMQKSEDIDSCIGALLNNQDADSSVVVAEARQSPHKALKITPDGRLVSYLTGKGRGAEPTKRQAYEKAYFRANIVATYPRVLKETGTLVGDHVRHHIIPQERAVDIDSEIDFFIAEQLMRKFKDLNIEK